LYDEYGRHTLAMRGEETQFATDGRRQSEPLAEAAGPAWFRLEDWHEYHLICQGPTLELRIDGRTAARVTDHDAARAERAGVLALQLHSGPPTVVQSRNIQLNPTGPIDPWPAASSAAPAWSRVPRFEAVAWWALDEAGHGAQPPLRHVPQFEQIELNVRESGPGARPGAKVVRLSGAYFEADGTLVHSDRPLSLFVRAQPTQADETRTLASQLDAQGNLRWRLAFVPGDQGSNDLWALWQVRTDQGTQEARWRLPTDAVAAWHDWVASYDGQRLTLYCDGQLAAQTPHGGTLADGAHRLIVAGNDEGSSVGQSFLGDLETFAIWQRTLRTDEIGQLSANHR
jgi:hypothetical protein